MSFDALGLMPALKRAVDEAGYRTPSPVQAQAIPAVLQGRDVLAAAQTGTGKTAGFALPILQRLAQQQKGRQRSPRALILTPTRELAAQIHEAVTAFGTHLEPRLNADVVFGGVKINPQIARLEQGVDILVACPGRLLDLVSQRAIRLDHVEMLVLDEADRMLDMGFIHDIRRILKLLPGKRQNLLFSATFSKEIRGLTDKLLDNPVSIDVAPRNSAATTVDQSIYKVDKPAKSALLIHLIKQHDLSQVLVFTATKHMANRVVQRLERAGISAAAIHGNKSQNARTTALSGFKDGSVDVLVATDVAARGIDIEKLPTVINFELPKSAPDYVHRIGRTGRAGAEGQAISLVCKEEDSQLRQIERLIKRSINVQETPHLDVTQDAEPDNRQRQQSGGNRRNNGQANGQRHRNHRSQANGGNAQQGNKNASGGRRRRRGGNNKARSHSPSSAR